MEPSRLTARIRRGVLSRARRKLREVGPAYAIRLAFRRLTPARVFRSAGYALLTLEPKLVHTGMDFGEGQRWARPDDGALLRAFGHSQETIDERLAEGSRAFLWADDEGLVAYVWFHTGTHYDGDLRLHFRIGSEEKWLFDAMVDPDRRGGGLYQRLLGAATRSLAREGCSRIWIAIDERNRNSRIAHEKSGARQVNRVRAFRLFGVEWLHDGHLWRRRVGRDRLEIDLRGEDSDAEASQSPRESGAGGRMKMSSR